MGIAVTAGCGGTYGGISKREAVRVAQQVVPSQSGLRLNDVLRREFRKHHEAWLVSFKAKQRSNANPPPSFGPPPPKPADQCVLVWKADQRYRFEDPDVEFNVAQRVDRLWALGDDCAKLEHIVGPLPP